MLFKAANEEEGKKSNKHNLKFINNYESWYSEALEIVRQFLPYRIQDFVSLYKDSPASISGFQIGKSWGDGTYTIYLKFCQQNHILGAAVDRIESSLFDIQQLVQADIFDSEIDAAKELLKKKFLRGAGAIAGVVLEKHLAQVCRNHNVKIKKKNPTISDFNDRLKEEGVIETPLWRQIQHLGALRNLCDHNKSKEPKKEDVEDLIDGVGKITKTLF